MSEVKLRPCPFCGAKLENVHNKFWFHPTNNCVLRNFPVKNNDDEINKWNRRSVNE